MSKFLYQTNRMDNSLDDLVDITQEQNTEHIFKVLCEWYPLPLNNISNWILQQIQVKVHISTNRKHWIKHIAMKFKEAPNTLG